MSSKRRLRRKSCDGKKRYETAAIAFGYLRRMKRNYITHPETLQTYHCSFCKGFHLGNRGRPLASASAISQ